MSSGWIECVGIADRSAYDLKVHTKATKVDLVAREVFPEPKEMEVVTLKLNNGLLGKTFKLDNAHVVEALNAVREVAQGVCFSCCIASVSVRYSDCVLFGTVANGFASIGYYVSYTGTISHGVEDVVACAVDRG